MSDVVDRANKEQQAWLSEQIRNSVIRASATEDTECVDCGEPIGSERKRAMPSAVRCIKCALALEKKR